MPSSDPAQRYRDILDYIQAIRDHVADMAFADFDGDRKTQHAVIYGLQCISEAAVKLGYHAEEHAPEEDWANIRGFGNISRHEYGAVNLTTVWKIVEQSMPSLQRSCEAALHSLEASRD